MIIPDWEIILEIETNHICKTSQCKMYNDFLTAAYWTEALV